MILAPAVLESSGLQDVAGFLQLGIGVFCLVFLRTRLPPRVSGPIVEWNAFKEPTYVLYCAGMFLCFWGLYFGFYYVRGWPDDYAMRLFAHIQV